MPETLVRNWCERCQTYREGAQIRQVAGVGSCASCGSALRREVQRVTRPLFFELLRSFVFPVGSLAVAATWVLASLSSSFAAFLPLIGGLLSLTIVLSYLFAIIRVTSLGHDDFGSVSFDALHVTEWFHPLIRYVLTLLVAFLPALITLVVLGAAGAIASYAVALLGLVYLPAGLVVAARAEGCLAPLNPIPSLQLIARIPAAYLLTLLALSLAAGAGVGISLVERSVVGSSFLLALVGRVFELYAPSVMARMLGVMVREHAEVL
jgi:hypothetical protein